jgi:hypothetical protein
VRSLPWANHLIFLILHFLTVNRDDHNSNTYLIGTNGLNEIMSVPEFLTDGTSAEPRSGIPQAVNTGCRIKISVCTLTCNALETTGLQGQFLPT